MPKVLNEDLTARIAELARGGYSKAEAGRELSLDRATIRKYWPKGGKSTMSNGTEEKEKEGAEVPQGEEGFTNIVERFTGIIKKFKIKNAELVADHCAKGNLEDLEDVEARMREMGVHPSLVTQAVSFWADEIQQPIPKRLRQRMEKETGVKTKESREKEAEEKYAVDSETGVIRLAKENEKAVPLVEAQKLQRLIKKDLAELEEKETGGKKEPAFILGEKGAWTLNPDAKVGFGEFAVFQMYQESLKKGEPIDPVEELARREEASVRLKEAMGIKTGGGDTEMAMLDKLEKLGMLKKGEGGEGALLAQLDALGLLRKTGEGESSETMRALQTEVKELRDSLQKQEMDTVKGALGSLAKGLEELRNDMSNQGRLEGRYGLLEKVMNSVDSQVTGIRSDVKPVLMGLTGGGGGAESARRSPQEKAKITRGLKEAVVLEREAKDLEDELLFGKPTPVASAGAAAPAPVPAQ